VSFADVLYFAMVTITTVDYGDIVPLTPRARMLDAFVVAPVRILIWLLFCGTACQLVGRQYVEGYRMARCRHRSPPTSLCGLGYTDLSVVRKLLAKGTSLAASL
jgi:voltage-gated potassium channel